MNPAGWGFMTSLDFDWQFLSGKKTFRWPLVSLTLSAFSYNEDAHLISSDFLFCRSLFSALRVDRNVSRSWGHQWSLIFLQCHRSQCNDGSELSSIVHV